jgi:O-6-methylguanine DNA methyltransferase
VSADVKHEFTARVLRVVGHIPRGQVATYGDVAALAGRPGAARAVGNIMRESGHRGIPCHRVVGAAGRLGGYGGNEALKRTLLLDEGIPFSGRRVKLETCRIGRPRRITRRRTG